MYLLVLVTALLFSCIAETEDRRADATMYSEIQKSQLVSAPSGGWSRSGDLKTADPNQPLSFQVNFPTAGYYTLQFEVKPNANANGGSVKPIAEIVWTVGGNSVRRKVSVANGKSISGGGESIGVTIHDEATAIVSPQGLYQVSFSVSPGSRPSENQPATLDGAAAVSLANAATLTVPIPQNVGVISALVVGADNIGATLPIFIVQELDASSLVTKMYDSRTQSGFVAVNATSTQLEILNKSGATQAVSIIWGIDG